MRIQYISDIHLEFGPTELRQTDADLIIAAGDIGIGRDGLDWLKSLKKPVVYVAGNHEFYGQDYLGIVKGLRQRAKGSNVRFLEREIWHCGDLRFLGCTLWSDLGGEENEGLEDLVDSVNDFRKIRCGPEPLTAQHYVRLHLESRRWLHDELTRPFTGKTVVVTHHAPTLWSWRESPTRIKRHAYCNDLKELLHSFDIAAWFHGHTHAVSDYFCAGTRVLCNPRGYFPDHLVAEFDPGRWVEI